MEQGLGARQRFRAGTSATDPSKCSKGVGSSMQSRHLAHAEGEVAVSAAGLYGQAGDVWEPDRGERETAQNRASDGAKVSAWSL